MSQKFVLPQNPRYRKPETLAELKPCPFCGDTPVLDCLTYEDEYFVRCPSCEIQQVADNTKAQAIRLWNWRA